MAKKIYKIHPPIGFARVGDLDITRANFGTNIYMNLGTGVYKDSNKIIPIPAEFAVWEHELDSVGKIVNSRKIDMNSLDVEKMTWSVQLANKKAGFYEFHGKQGETTENKNPTRNPSPANWVMQPSPVTISNKSVSGVKINHVQSGSNQIPSTYLGEIWTGASGELFVFGGKGQSRSTDGSAIKHYANNAKWYDDVSDGPVKVTLKLKGEANLTPVDPAWVIVGPPDFAPDVHPIVSLYDTQLNMIVTKMAGNVDTYNMLTNYPNLADLYNSSGYKPHFHDDIAPILEAALNIKYVYDLGPFHMSFSVDVNMASGLRDMVFSKFRNPADGKGGNMPKLHGDGYDTTGSIDQMLSVTPTQYKLLERWKDGNYIKSAGPTKAKAPFAADLELLRKIIGGAFFPGIEVGWQIRNPNLYHTSDPFRIDHNAKDQYNAALTKGKTISAGYFTRQMAVPWQADFTACQKDVGSFTNGWWPTQRPDDVPVAPGSMLPWFRDSSNTRLNDMNQLVTKWKDMGFVVKDSGGKFKEEFRNP